MAYVLPLNHIATYSSPHGSHGHDIVKYSLPLGPHCCARLLVSACPSNRINQLVTHEVFFRLCVDSISSLISSGAHVVTTSCPLHLFDRGSNSSQSPSLVDVYRLSFRCGCLFLSLTKSKSTANVSFFSIALTCDV